MANPQSNLDELMKDPKAAGLLKNKALLQSLMQFPKSVPRYWIISIRNRSPSA